MKRVLGGLVVVMLVIVGCGGGSDAIDDCETLADESIAVIQGVIDDLDALTLEEQANLGDSASSPLLDDIESRFDELAERAAGLECSSAVMSDLVGQRFASLDAQSDFGNLVLDQLQSAIDEGGFLSQDP